MATIHGVTGFQSGCRCSGCLSTESQRSSYSERERWEVINQCATRRAHHYFADAPDHPLNWQKPGTFEEITTATTPAQVLTGRDTS
jgi:hypothetical protein